MNYDYSVTRAVIFTERGMQMFLKIRDKAKELCEISGAVREEELYKVCSGDTWDMLACVDYLVERGELKRVFDSCVRQHNVYVKSC